MSEKRLIITEQDGKYELRNEGISDFALIGILECLLFELKSARREVIPIIEEEQPISEDNTAALEHPALPETMVVEEQVEPQTPEVTPAVEPPAPDVRIRIKKAVEAIKGLGGEVEDLDLEKMSDQELQTEFEELTNQYKRLKNSQATKKVIRK